MITAEEIRIVHEALGMALRHGAQKARATLNKSSEDFIATLNGEIDRVTRSDDRSISISLIADGRYGSFSTNKLDKESLEAFIVKGIGITRMLAADSCRDLTDPGHCCRDAVTGLELEVCDPAFDQGTPESRAALALKAAVFGSDKAIISEEGEYSESIYDTYLADTQGLSCRHIETSYDYGVEITVEDGDGDKYSGYWWDSSPFRDKLKAEACGGIALRRALAQIGSEPAPGGKYNMVIDSDVASKVVSPILRALSAYAIQQNNSFLMDSLGEKRFPDGMTIMDLPRIKGQSCSKYFDSEGAVTVDAPIIEAGVVKQYFINSYMSNKLGMAPTIEEATRPKVMPWPKPGLGRDDILAMCGDGIYVTDFNGGNSNATTGGFSYGVEGFLFKDGKIVRPVSGMLVTGDFISLWSHLVAAGDDARDCMSKLIPTLAFSNVDFNG